MNKEPGYTFRHRRYTKTKETTKSRSVSPFTGEMPATATGEATAPRGPGIIRKALSTVRAGTSFRAEGKPSDAAAEESARGIPNKQSMELAQNPPLPAGPGAPGSRCRNKHGRLSVLGSMIHGRLEREAPRHARHRVNRRMERSAHTKWSGFPPRGGWGSSTRCHLEGPENVMPHETNKRQSTDTVRPRPADTATRGHWPADSE